MGYRLEGLEMVSLGTKTKVNSPYTSSILVSSTNLEDYQSGHTEAVLKTVGVKAPGGSNPSTQTIFSIFKYKGDYNDGRV